MSIVIVGMVAFGSATLGFLTAALLSGAKGCDHRPMRGGVPDGRVLSHPSQN